MKKNIEDLKVIKSEKPDVWIGIDTGVKGAIAVITEDNKVMLKDWENLNLMASYLKEINKKYYIRSVTIEDVSLGGSGYRGVAVIMQNKGEWLGMISMLSCPVYLVRPKKWQKKMHRRRDGDNYKKRSVGKCLRLFTELSKELIGPRGGLKDDRAEAILIALYTKGDLE